MDVYEWKSCCTACVKIIWFMTSSSIFFFFSSQSFSQARVVNKSGTKLVDEIAKDLKVMVDVRINAVKVTETLLTSQGC